MPDFEDDLPLQSDVLKEPATLEDDDEENQELPAETDPAPGVALDDLMTEDIAPDDDVDFEDDDADAP